MFWHHCLVELCHCFIDVMMIRYLPDNPWDSAVFEATFFSFLNCCISASPYEALKVLVCCFFVFVLYIRKFKRFRYNASKFNSWKDLFHEVPHFLVGCFFQVKYSDFDLHQAVSVSLAFLFVTLVGKLELLDSDVFLSQRF